MSTGETGVSFEEMDAPARDGGAPDQADNQVATNFSSVHNSGTSDPSPASSVRVCAWPPPTALACVRMPITATASPQAAAKRTGCLRR